MVVRVSNNGYLLIFADVRQLFRLITYT